jgi:hypothetical protein
MMRGTGAGAATPSARGAGSNSSCRSRGAVMYMCSFFSYSTVRMCLAYVLSVALRADSSPLANCYAIMQKRWHSTIRTVVGEWAHGVSEVRGLWVARVEVEV